MYRYRGGMKMLDSNRVEMDLKPQTRHGRVSNTSERAQSWGITTRKSS